MCRNPEIFCLFPYDVTTCGKSSDYVNALQKYEMLFDAELSPLSFYHIYTEQVRYDN